MFEVGQMVMLGKDECTIIGISKDPFIEFKDGSKHYALTIVRISDGALTYVNDAQIEVIKDENNGNRV